MQLSLFQSPSHPLGQTPVKHPSSTHLCRSTDPATSREAALSAAELACEHQQIILATLRRIGPSGKDRIASNCGLTGVQICRRLIELERAGEIEQTGALAMSASGRKERVWRVVA